MKFLLSRMDWAAPILVEAGAYPGVARVAGKVAKDIGLAGYAVPGIYENREELTSSFGGRAVLFATVGKSPLLEELQEKGLLSLEQAKGKREVYAFCLLKNPWEGMDELLVIYGSDKRGTIYGMFALSQRVGVSPVHFLTDSVPEKKKERYIEAGDGRVSLEPSVKYRGFFINDEWPCFGTWTFEHFGGFTAEMYDHIFELLLRLNGNYLWPAMWTSSFALDGPGLASAELADLYGIIMGNSHHEPCLRASEEWDIYRGEGSVYGNEWNFRTNREGLLHYWEDGLKRSGKYEGMVTIGMRGERDSAVLGSEASLRQNIDLLKIIITEQKRLIVKHINEDITKVPMLLALYKEVEPYFYGDEQTPGLKDWEGLDGVTLLFCEDNMGNMRTLPSKDMQGHKGGFGMYYHFDYHGDPISYEWVNSTPLSKVWEQMTMAYEYGVRDLWIVNVGDLKFNEFPLSYFMTLAYDFDTWGTRFPNRTGEFTKAWVCRQFGSRVSREAFYEIVDIQTAYVRLNGKRRPEALNSRVYHPVHYKESDFLIREAKNIIAKSEHLYDNLEMDARNCFYSTVFYPAVASMNLLLMHLYAGKNAHFAGQGKTIANHYAKLVTECIEKDRRLADEFGLFLGGKWNGMQMAQHIGFTKWNEDNYRYPLRIQVEAAHKPRMVVSREDEESIAVKDYFAPMVIEIRDFLSPPHEKVRVQVANGGTGSFRYEVEMSDCAWLTWVRETDTVCCQELLTICCDRNKLPLTQERQVITLSDGDTKVEIHVYGRREITEGLEPMTFLEDRGVIAMEANHYQALERGREGYLEVLEDYGKCGYGLKAFPLAKDFLPGEEPAAYYSFKAETAGEYTAEIWTAPSNPVTPGGRLKLTVQLNQNAPQIIDSLPEGFAAGVPHNEGWERGALDQVRVCNVTLRVNEGVNRLRLGILDAGLVLERIYLYREENKPKKSYLGAPESYYIPLKRRF